MITASRRLGRQGRLRDDLHHQLADIVTGCRRTIAAIPRSSRGPYARTGCLTRWWNSCSTNASCASSLSARNVGQLADAGELHRLARARLVAARRVDRLALLLVAEAADGVEVLQREAERVDHPVAGLARLRAASAASTRSRVVRSRVQVRRQRRDGFGRRPQRPAQHAAGQEHAAMDRRAGRRVGERRHQVRMRQHARPARPDFERHLLERRVGRQVDAVELRQPAVQIQRRRPAAAGGSRTPRSRPRRRGTARARSAGRRRPRRRSRETARRPWPGRGPDRP